MSNQPRDPYLHSSNYRTVPITIVSPQLSTLDFCIFLLQIGWLKHPMAQRIYAPQKKLQNFPKLFRVILFEYSRNLSPTSASKLASLGKVKNNKIWVTESLQSFQIFAYRFFAGKSHGERLFSDPKSSMFWFTGFFRLLKRLIQDE